MNLSSFLPYRLAVLADAVSRTIAQVYSARFRLSRDAWRVLAALSEVGAMKTTAVIAHTTLEKMQVSRAVASLIDDGLVVRDADPDDRRGHVLRLTPAGQSLMKKLVPMVLAREAFLLEALDPDERRAFIASCRKLEQRARQLIEQG